MSDVERDEAVRLAGEVGAKVAGERLGVPASTVRAWASKQRRSGGELAAAGVSERQLSSSGGGLDDIERLRRDVSSIQRLMQRAVQHANRALQDGKSADAQRAAVTMGISADKLGQLSSVLSGLESQRVRLSGDQAQLLAAVIHLSFEAIGIRPTESVRALVADLLRQASSGGPLAVSPALAQPAWSDVRERIAADVRRELEEEFRQERERMPALPAPAEPEQAEVVLAATPEPAAPEPIQDVDVVYADDVPGHFLEAYGDEPLARSAWEAHKQRQAAIARRDAEQGRLPAYRPSTWKDIHDIFGANSSMRNPGGHV